MHQYPSSVQPVRAAGGTPYGIATPSQPIEPKKASAVASSRLVARVPHAPATAVPVASVPTPAIAQTNRQKQPQLQHLPRFQPPVFEGADGLLPCPDSPGSSRAEEEDEQQEFEEAPSKEEGTETTPVATRGKQEDAGLEEEKAAPFAVGSYVEYKSRSSGLWILAKVEAYDASSKFYRLDVQPHAHQDRVRHRTQARSAEGDAASRGRDRDGRRERNALRDRDSVRDSGRERDAARESEAGRERGPARESDTGRDRNGLESEVCSRERHVGRDHDAAYAERDVGSDAGREVSVPSNIEALAQAGMQVPMTYPARLAPDLGQHADAFKDISVAESLSPVVGYGVPSKQSRVTGEPSVEALAEVAQFEQQAEAGFVALRTKQDLTDDADMLRQQVSVLQAENATLQERLRQEVALKEKYFSELCVCHEQLQRHRVTPR